MDLQQFVNQIDAMTCIMSVEEKKDGSCGEIRIVTGNKAYIDSIVHPSPDVPMICGLISSCFRLAAKGIFITAPIPR